MLYYLDRLSEHATSDFFKAFNVFQYVTFRAVGAALTAFVLSLAFGNFTIRKLLSLKLGQPIRNADEVHKLAELHGQKAGTPTMGGILLLGSTVLSTLLWARPDNSFVWLVLGAMLAAGALGFADDYLKVSKKNSAGVSERTKILVQLLIALGVTYFSSPTRGSSGRPARSTCRFTKRCSSRTWASSSPSCSSRASSLARRTR